MPETIRELLKEALSLPAAERADIAAELLASLDAPTQPAEVTQEWVAETYVTNASRQPRYLNKFANSDIGRPGQAGTSAFRSVSVGGRLTLGVRRRR